MTFTASAVLCAAIVLQQSVRFVDLIVNRGLPVVISGIGPADGARFSPVLLIAVFGVTLFTYMRMQKWQRIGRAAGSWHELGKPCKTRPIAAFWVMLISMVFSLY